MIALLRSEITRRLERRPLKRRFSRPVTKAAFRVNSEELAGSEEVDFSAAAVLRRMGEAAVRCIERASVINDWHESKEGGEMDRRAIKLGICGGYALLFVLLGSHALSADSPPVGSYNLPSKQQT